MMRRFFTSLIPRTHWTSYGRETAPGSGDFKPHFTVWKMWFGRCYNVIDVEVAGS
jgi:hypothetical protein